MSKRYCMVLCVLMFVLAGRDVQAKTNIFWVAEGSKASDFDGNGRVDFTDFLILLKNFNTLSSDAVYDPRTDLDGNGVTNFSDFLAFSSSYGFAQAPVVPTSNDNYAIYVADSDDSSVSALDNLSHIMFDYLPFRAPGAVVISPDQQFLYVSEVFGFFKLNTQHQVVFSVPVESRGRIALNADATRAYVTDQSADLLRVVNLVTGVTLDSVAVGRNPIDIAITPDGRKLYVTNQTDRNVTVIDVASLRVITQITIGSIPGEITFAPNGQRAFITNLTRGVISVIDVNTDRVVGAIQLDQESSFGAELSPDGSILYVSAEGFLLAIDVARNLILRTLQVAEQTTVLGIVPDGSRAYIASFDQVFGGPGMTVVDLQNWKVLGRLRGFLFPRQIAFRKLPAQTNSQ